MTITRELVAQKMAAYLKHEANQAELVDWAENAMMEGEFDPRDHDKLRDVISRLGLADVRAFGLTWEDCELLLEKLGYAAHVELTAR